MESTPRSSTVPALVLGLCLGLGVAAAGGLVARALYHVRAAERFVTVKGLSEREVPADLALWPVVFTVTGNDLSQTQTQVEKDAGEIRAYLSRFGFGDDEMSLSAPRVSDQWAQSYGNQRPPSRYLVESTLTLRSGKIDLVSKAIQQSGDLVRQGVTVIRSYEYSTQYLFTKLNEIKPEMIAEATKDARHAAEKFAEDSGSQVGGIRRAEQGYFSIEDRDAYSPEIKKIRVVTTVDYFLVDE